jgi:hypothetical protein
LFIKESLDLSYPTNSRTEEVAVKSFDSKVGELYTVWIGTEEGKVYQANLTDSAGV